MSDLTIGLSGLRVAQRAIEIVGQNLANAATEGYHRQEIIVSPVPGTTAAGLNVGNGAEVTEIRRVVNLLLDREIQRQRPELGSTAQELATLQVLEAVVGDLSEDGLSGAIDRFFGSLRELAAQPDSDALRVQAVWAAENLAARFRGIGSGIESLMEQTAVEAQSTVNEINTLLSQIAGLNTRIRELSVRGFSDGSLLDLRDKAVSQLADLADVTIQQGADGAYTVQIMGVMGVLQGSAAEITVDYADGQALGVSVKGTGTYDTSARGGRLGGILALNNDLLPAIRDAVDALAGTLIDQINRLHVQGIGTDGSFTELSGQNVGPDTLDAWETPVAAGQVFLRVIDTATGEVTRHAVSIDPATQTIDDVAALFNAVPHLSASAPGGALHIQADVGYRFDFLPALAPAPATSSLTGSAQPTVSGVYAGAANETFTCTVVGAGSVGVTSGLAVEVRNGAGEVVRSLNVGQGYAAADTIEVADGVRVSFAAGTLNGGEQFTIDALADADPTGLLAAAGVNTLFSGRSALTMRVVADVRESSGRLATSRGAGAADNLNVLRMADLADQPLDAVGGVTPGDAFRHVISTVGEWVAVRQARKDGLEGVLQQLQNQADTASGVDVNEEAARLLVFERMFQGMARYLAALDRARQALLDVI